ncbi:dihydrodipicolinate synthase family protein [Rhodocaloribacter litoris]|uniref:dihydrodipicolinate synthase family protein n=1 Tax=Rhodocaloribacter litoris TaxID=2558931 RepID=UPI001422A80D|nr:dihydrodipicolinate synthase family protein [Rhodocaloribacter litoris]QXD15088.1 dihydrodipicolinate synthase family protein [Rhodocaloribacter litoris]
MKYKPLTGLVAAAFTPLQANGALDLDRIPAVVDHLQRDGVSALYILGSTGEGVSLTTQERMAVAEAYVQAARGRLPVVVQVGHNSLAEARTLAAHAQHIGADAISAMPPEYFKPETIEVLVDSLAEITQAAPELPFYYYHIPALTGVHLSMEAFLQQGSKRLSTLAGIKFSDRRLEELQACRHIEPGRFDVLFGVDEMFLSGLVLGVRGAVGSTYNFAAPLFRRILHYVETGNLERAEHLQARANRMIQAILHHGGRGGLKAVMSLIGLDLGGHRLPLQTPGPDALRAMRQALENMGFFEWARASDIPLSSDGELRP